MYTFSYLITKMYIEATVNIYPNEILIIFYSKKLSGKNKTRNWKDLILNFKQLSANRECKDNTNFSRYSLAENYHLSGLLQPVVSAFYVGDIFPTKELIIS